MTSIAEWDHSARTRACRIGFADTPSISRARCHTLSGSRANGITIACVRSLPGKLSRRKPTCGSLFTLMVTDAQWPVMAADAVICINMIHIAPWSVAQALLRGASRILPSGGLLCLYGPYRVAGKHTSASNRAFDTHLRAINSEWGVRDLDAVSNEARAFNVELERIFQMPANNLIAILRKSAG